MESSTIARPCHSVEETWLPFEHVICVVQPTYARGKRGHNNTKQRAKEGIYALRPGSAICAFKGSHQVRDGV